MCVKKCQCNTCFKKHTCTDCSYMDFSKDVDCRKDGVQGCKHYYEATNDKRCVNMSNTIKYGISTYVAGDIVYFRGEKLPPAPRSSNKQTVFVGDTICINGYEWKDGKWKRTLRALWHLWF